MKVRVFLFVVCLAFFSASSFAEWTEWKSNSRYNNVYTDIQAHYYDSYDYTCDDKSGTVHETTHGINAYLRNKYPKYNWFYVLNDRAFRLKLHNVKTLTQVARAVPQQQRTSTYKLYLVDQARYWNEIPSYICDEWSAYHNGTLMAIDEFGPQSSRAKFSYSNMNEMYNFMLILSKLEGNNKDLEMFLQFASAESKRIGQIINMGEAQ